MPEPISEKRLGELEAAIQGRCQIMKLVYPNSFALMTPDELRELIRGYRGEQRLIAGLSLMAEYAKDGLPLNGAAELLEGAPEETD